MDSCCMGLMLHEDLENVNPMHEFICMYICGMWLLVMLMIMLRWDDIDVDNDIRWDDVDVDDVIVMMYVVYVHRGCSDYVGYP